MDIFEPNKLVFPRIKMLKSLTRSNTDKEYFSSEEIGSILRRVFKDVEFPIRKDGTKTKTNYFPFFFLDSAFDFPNGSVSNAHCSLI